MTWLAKYVDVYEEEYGECKGKKVKLISSYRSKPLYIDCQ